MSSSKDYLQDLPTLSYDRKGDLGNSKSHKGLQEDKPSTVDQKKKGQNCSVANVKFPHTFVKIPYEDIELGECCGEGTFGTVYRAQWKTQAGKDVAVKTLSRMDDEVHILSILSHRNIIQFYGACADVPNYCLVTEYAPYGSLYSFLGSPKSENLEFAQVLSWARDVALGMNYLHEEAPIQVVHRDLKSKNVLICHDFTLKICDFGASRLFDETTVMTIAGTYPWMAPELIQGLPTSEACDVYSYGVVLWELLTREVPFKGLQGFQVAWIVVEKHERPVIPMTCPGKFGDLMKACWSKDVDQRPTFSEVVVELNQMITDVELEQETDSFMHGKDGWIAEVQTKMKDIRQEEARLEAQKETAKERDEIMREWARKLREELKDKSLFHFQYSKTQESFNCEISGTGDGAVDTVKDAINHMMSKGGLQGKAKDEKFGTRPDSFRSSNGTSPLFGTPLSRQGSTSSMESSRSLSLHSDMTYDMTKMNLETSPVKFMDSTDGFSFPKSKEKQSPVGGSKSKVKLQKQMSASSEEYQFEGKKMSRSGNSSDGNEGAVKAEGKDVETWESATGKARVNQTNESLNFESGTSPELAAESLSSTLKQEDVPTVEALEKALKNIDLSEETFKDPSMLARKLNEQLQGTQSHHSQKKPKAAREAFSDSPLLDWNNQATAPRCKCRTKSPPVTKNMPFSLSQKPPLRLSPTKIVNQMPFTADGIHQRPKSLSKSIKTQTEVSAIVTKDRVDSMTQTDIITPPCRKNGESPCQVYQSPRMERASIDVPVADVGECVRINLEKLLPQKSTVYIDHIGPHDESSDHATGQAFRNPPVRNVSLNGRSGDHDEKPRRISLPTRFPSSSRAGARARMTHASSFDHEEEQTPAWPSTSGRLFLTRGNGVSSHQSDIYETDDYTYIICPNKSRQKFF